MLKKLKFKAETVRALSDRAMRGVVGGGYTVSDGACSKHVTSCSTFGDGGCGNTLDFSCAPSGGPCMQSVRTNCY